MKIQNAAIAADQHIVVAWYLTRAALASRWPQIDLGPVTWGIFEPGSGVLMARRGVQAAASQAARAGATPIRGAAVPPVAAKGRLGAIDLESFEDIVDRNRQPTAQFFFESRSTSAAMRLLASGENQKSRKGSSERAASKRSRVSARARRFVSA